MSQLNIKDVEDCEDNDNDNTVLCTDESLIKGNNKQQNPKLSTTRSQKQNSLIIKKLLKNYLKPSFNDNEKKEEKNETDANENDKISELEKELVYKDKLINYLSSFVSTTLINDLNFKQSLINNSNNFGSLLFKDEVENSGYGYDNIKNKKKFNIDKKLFKDSSSPSVKKRIEKELSTNKNMIV